MSGNAPLSLSVRKVSVARGGRRVLDDVSISVAPAEITALLGPNGAGKSTLVLALGGVLPLMSGQIELGGQSLTDLRPEQVRATGVAIVPEGRRLLPNLTVAENLRVAAYSTRIAGDRQQRTDEVLAWFPELRRRWHSPARLLSGGEQQMVVIAQALMSRPAILALDELSLGLAPVIVKRLMPTLEAVAAAGVGVLLIEQFAHVALALSKRAYILEGGRIHYEGTASELRDAPDLMRSAYLLRR